MDAGHRLRDPSPADDDNLQQSILEGLFLGSQMLALNNRKRQKMVTPVPRDMVARRDTEVGEERTEANKSVYENKNENASQECLNGGGEHNAFVEISRKHQDRTDREGSDDR